MKLLACGLALWASGAEAACRQALALGLDVSGSVDAGEYRLQLDGLASALRDADVQSAFLAFPEAPVRLYVFEWAGPGSQRVLIAWRDIRTRNDLEDAATVLARTNRIALEQSTAIGEALLFAGAALAQQDACWRHVIDLSGDGPSNTGPRPAVVAHDPVLSRVTVNGLVIGADAPAYSDTRAFEIGEIWAYYTENVIRGPDAFVEVALGFEDFADSMARKLLREVSLRPMTSLPIPSPTRPVQTSQPGPAMEPAQSRMDPIVGKLPGLGGRPEAEPKRWP